MLTGQTEDTGSSFPRLKVGEMEYDAVLVSNCHTLRSTTLNILEKFKQQGGRVIFTGEIPYLENARPSDRGRKLAEKTDVIPFGRLQILKALEDLREIEI